MISIQAIILPQKKRKEKEKKKKAIINNGKRFMKVRVLI